MNTDQPRTPARTSPPLTEEAAHWIIAFNDPPNRAGVVDEFNEWMRRTPRHIHAYFEMDAAWEEAGRLDPARRSSPDAIVARVLTQESRARPRLRRAAPFAFLAALLFLIGFFEIWHTLYRNTYSTGVGEQRTIALSDGSSIKLNTQSKIRFRYTGGERTGTLLEGQALFDVRPDSTRPFIVRIHSTSVLAVGTQFDIYRAPDATTITVFRGSVSVTEENRHRDVAPLVLEAGQRLIMPSGGPWIVSRIDPVQALAWTRGQLIFDQTPLSQVVAELNRYNALQLRIDDPTLAALHIRGTFDARDPQTLIRFLEGRGALTSTRAGQELRLSSAPTSQ